MSDGSLDDLGQISENMVHSSQHGTNGIHGMNDEKRQGSATMADKPPSGASAADGIAVPAEKRPGRLADTERVVIDAAGRLVVPAKFRKALGIRGRAELVASLKGDSVRLRTVDAALDRLRGIAMRKRADAGRPLGNAVDDFIAGRRGDAGEE